ncbi:MAG: DNA repair protein RadA [Chlamydiota bacterium]
MKRSKWRCQTCGNQEVKWAGVCSKCKEWNTFVEERAPPVPGRQVGRPVALHQVFPEVEERMVAGWQEWDRLLGGGAVPGGLHLIGGAPGVGKSTLLLQVAHRYAMQGHKVLYISGEETERQVSLRAERLKIASPHLFLFSETRYEAIEEVLREMQPTFLFVDSIQILWREAISAAPGSIVQVRELASCFMRLAKEQSITTFLIGHMTKAGDLAGPRVLEHLVDTVFEFEGEKKEGLRLLRSIKNRFGATDYLAVFQMQETGLQAVANPSRLFLQDRGEASCGSAVAAAVEGTRAFLIETQALVTRSFATTPCRKSTGVDQNRISLLLAVLEKSVGYRMHAQDVFVSLAGGIKVKEAAIDLAIACAIASSLTRKPLPAGTLFLGEVGLCGALKGCSQIGLRLQEARHLGFTKVLVPKKQETSPAVEKARGKMEVLGARTVAEAIALMGS